MRSRIVTVLSLLAVGVLLCSARPVDAGPLQSDAERLCGHYPQGAWAEASHPSILPTDPSGSEDCEELCDKWTALCRNIVKVRKKCWTSAAAQTERLRKAECNTLTDPAARTACQDVIKAEKDALKRYLEVVTGWGVTSCEQEGHGACTLHCE